MIKKILFLNLFIIFILSSCFIPTDFLYTVKNESGDRIYFSIYKPDIGSRMVIYENVGINDGEVKEYVFTEYGFPTSIRIEVEASGKYHESDETYSLTTDTINEIILGNNRGQLIIRNVGNDDLWSILCSNNPNDMTETKITAEGVELDASCDTDFKLEAGAYYIGYEIGIFNYVYDKVADGTIKAGETKIHEIFP